MKGDEELAPTDERKALARVLYEFLGPAAKETGKLIADQVRLYRWRLAVKIVQRAEKYAKDRNIESTEMPYNFLVPFIEKASLSEDSDGLIGFWANLLVDASKKTEAKHRVFFDILYHLNQPQAVLLQNMYRTLDVSRRHLWAEPLNFDRGLDEIRRELRELVRQIYGKTSDSRTSDSFIALTEWWKERKIPGLIVSQGVGTKQPDSDSFENPNDFLELGGELFDIFNLCQLRLLIAKNFNFDVQRAGVRPVTVHIRALILSPLGYAFLETCEGGRSSP
ncbi:MAG TPA: hypothetical protein VN808_17280 [Stellaceae bacterium]|nr:hypothetical protein [Stellaceae bacterium]